MAGTERVLEVRRHTYTKKEDEGRAAGSSLSQAGVDLARSLGAGLGPFDYVMTSPVPRTMETAPAMGFVVDEVQDMGGPDFEEAEQEKGDRHAQRQWGDRAFAIYAELIATGGATARFSGCQGGVWLGVIRRHRPGRLALVITHGGCIEPGLVGLFPDADHTGWGAALSYGEGARLHFADEQAARIELVRVRPA